MTPREIPLPALTGAVLCLIGGGDPFPLVLGGALSVVAGVWVAASGLGGVRVRRLPAAPGRARIERPRRGPGPL